MKKQRRKPQQIVLQSSSWGGRRHGAGRPKKKGAGVSHSRRAKVRATEPLHVTVRLRSGLPSLRSRKTFTLFQFAAQGAKQKGLRILEFAVLGNHFHLLVEADNNRVLSQGMKSLNIRLAKNLNRLRGLVGGGAVLMDRYHVEKLSTPRQFRNGLIYLFANASKHFGRTHVVDEYSSFSLFPFVGHLKKFRRDLDWQRPRIQDHETSLTKEILSEPRSWIARTGWRKAPA